MTNLNVLESSSGKKNNLFSSIRVEGYFVKSNIAIPLKRGLVEGVIKNLGRDSCSVLRNRSVKKCTRRIIKILFSNFEC